MANTEQAVSRKSSEMDIKGSSRRLFKFTIEISLFLSMLGSSMSGSAIKNIVFYRTCVYSLKHTADECVDYLSPIRSNSTRLLENDVQKYATYVFTVQTVMESIAPAVLSLFLGVWSDTYGRKPIIVWPLFGMTLSSILVVIYGLIDMNPWWLILTVLPFSLTGGNTVLLIGVYCYVSDIATTENTSLRMTVIDAFLSMAIVVGSLLSTYLIIVIGNVNLLLLAASLNVMSYSISNICIKESLTGAMKVNFRKILNWGHVKEMAYKCFKRRPNYGRALILLPTAARSISVFVIYGTGGIEYQYTRRTLQWALAEYNTYSAVSTTVTFIGNFVGVLFIQKLLSISDLVLAAIAFLSAVVEYMIKAVVVTSWQMYLSISVALFKGLSGPLIRSFLSKTVPVEDIAKVYAMMCAIEGLCPLIAPIIFSSVYVETLKNLPGTVYFVSSGFNVICLILLGIVQYYCWKAPTATKRINDP